MGVGSDSLSTMKFTSVIDAALIWTCQVSCDWTGSGRLQCYGVADTDVSTPAGGNYLERGNLKCTLEEWVYESGRGPRRCSSNLSRVESLKSGRGTTIRPTFRGLSATETSGTRTTTWELGTALLTRGSMAVATLTVLELLPAMAARQSYRVSNTYYYF